MHPTRSLSFTFWPTGFSATINPTPVISSGTATTQTAGPATVTVVGGSGQYLYSWSWAYGGSGIQINGFGAAAATFTATLNPGQTLTGSAVCTVYDVVTGLTTKASVSVTMTCTAMVITDVTVDSTITVDTGGVTVDSGPPLTSAGTWDWSTATLTFNNSNATFDGNIA